MAVTDQLFLFGALGVLSLSFALWANRRLLDRRRVGPVSPLEGVFYLIGEVALGLGWYFNVRYAHHAGTHASYINYTKALFDNWASDSAAQDYIIVNLVLFPLWSIVDGRRRGLRAPWIFFVMSLFTSLAFSVGLYLAFVERQIRYNRTELAVSGATEGGPDEPRARKITGIWSAGRGKTSAKNAGSHPATGGSGPRP
jgi:hypothetical protein